MAVQISYKYSMVMLLKTKTNIFKSKLWIHSFVRYFKNVYSTFLFLTFMNLTVYKKAVLSVVISTETP